MVANLQWSGCLAGLTIDTRNSVERWKKQFSEWNVTALRAGAKSLRPYVPPPSFTALDMYDQWTTYWCPALDCEPRTTSESQQPDCSQSWRDLASEFHLPQVEQKEFRPPSHDEFFDALYKAKGCPGFDGWHQRAICLANDPKVLV